jgi:hypothetical protein
VLLAIADRADDEGVAWPSMGDISRRCGVGVATVQRAVSKLIELKEIEVFEGGAGKRSNRYVVLTGRDQEAPVAFRSGTQDDAGSVPERNKRMSSVPERNTRGSASHSGAEHQSSGAEQESSSYSAPSNEPTYVGRQANQPHRPPDNRGLRVPGWAQSIINELEAKGIVVSWKHRMSDLRWVQLQQLLGSHGQPYLVHLAGLRYDPTNPIKFATLLLDIWQEYGAPRPGTAWHPDTVTARDSPKPSAAPLPEWCGKCDSPDYRWLDNGTGYVRCRNCNPDAMGDTR